MHDKALIKFSRGQYCWKNQVLVLCIIVLKLLFNLLSRVPSYSHLFQVLLLGDEGFGGGMSLLSECEIWLFHILRSSPCPFQCFTHLKVTCCHFIQSLACGEQTLFLALVSPAKRITKKTSAPLRLSSLVLLFQGHVACGNCYPNMVLIPTHSSLALQGQVGENTRKRLTISSFQQKKCVIFVHPISDQSLTSDSSLFIPLGI